MSRSNGAKQILNWLLLLPLCLDMSCGTRAGNPQRPKIGGGEETKNEPVLVDFPEIPLAAIGSRKDLDDSALIGDQKGVIRISENSYTQVRVITQSLRDLSEYIRGEEIYLNQKAEFKIKNTTVSAIVTKEDDIFSARFCVADRTFYEFRWNEDKSRIWTRRDVERSPSLSAVDREIGSNYFVNIDIEMKDGWPTFSAKMKGMPSNVDIFLPDRQWEISASVAQFTPQEEMYYKHAVRWGSSENKGFDTVYFNAAGRYGANDVDHILMYHAEFPVLCKGKVFDAANTDAPGWCMGFRTNHAVEGQASPEFILKAGYDLIWNQIKSIGVLTDDEVVAPEGFEKHSCSIDE